jgi:hypothetical protein
MHPGTQTGIVKTAAEVVELTSLSTGRLTQITVEIDLVREIDSVE